MYYVTMTDKFLSGWGRAKNKIAKYIYLCNTYLEATIVKNNAELRGDQKNVNIRTTKPNYDHNTHITTIKDKKANPNWYIKNFFQK